MLVKLTRSPIIIITLSTLARPQKGEEVRWLARKESIKITAGDIAHKDCHNLSKYMNKMGQAYLST